MIYRKSIDTLYVGLSIEFSELKETINKIKKNLFFKDFLKDNYMFCSNRFYQCESKCEQFGFYMYSCPRKNCKNDMITIQLTGKFFRNIVRSRNFVKFLFKEFYEVLVFQRVDVALDVIYSESDISNVAICLETGTRGFPLPRYSNNWKKSRSTFMTYGRLNSVYDSSSHIINMISQGKNDVVFRVYDKTLDLKEKYDSSYSEYYSYKDENTCFQVYRIELQARSDKLKKFVDDLKVKVGIYEVLEYNLIIDEFIAYIFTKFDFLFIDKSKICNTECDCDFSVRKVSTIKGMMEYYKRQQNHSYKMYSLYYSYYCDEIKQLQNENVQLKPLIDDYNKEVVYKYRLDNADFNDFVQGTLDLEQCSKEINKENIPF